jgi:hypothetical protein
MSLSNINLDVLTVKSKASISISCYIVSLLTKSIAPIYEEVLPDYQFATVLGIPIRA